ncbi:MAG: 4a-hydroxytetrahydrobiopterin dehydratase [Candidatus Yanofskybacteria bacterium CG10_big_fil_rev_8_21_14_0_10_36_16]|uniref:Putative pterin-4-alpha-carbinolamine dehydratase n=1 Tax=Candidatus Yanofskybacteria bacterium CG10_big_fil_rev_8_21_14_0_10_36_16 TaxID=1975096 RepID=A0A2J0Q6R0_9BACT|nr:MAG: 4a-hydroxytetrahydrobiopterin dehydratase [Candidatus Yanofskybacteria bacterium CG10_big_fil_rev_8_21_14_0_10_36_16]
MNNLSSKHCVPCEGGAKPLEGEELADYLKQVKDWQVLPIGEGEDDNRKISKEFKFKEFKESMIFVNKIANIAESESHHPDVHIFYNTVKIELWTHAIGGLSENDFILASKIDNI